MVLNKRKMSFKISVNKLSLEKLSKLFNKVSIKLKKDENRFNLFVDKFWTEISRIDYQSKSRKLYIVI